MERTTHEHDLLVSGAGPAGLATAIFAARAGRRVLVLEKEEVAGRFPRGETLRPDPIVDELLGPDFMDGISLHRTAKRRYWSPGAKKSFELERSHASHVFAYGALIGGLVAAAEEAGATIQYDSDVVSPLVRNGRCTGVVLASGEQLLGETVVAADGHRSALATGVDSARITCPIAKRICHGVTTDFTGMEFFAIARGAIEPDFPAALAFVFPRGGTEAEVGVMLLGASLPADARAQMPGLDRMLPFLQRLFDDYPVFSDRVGSATWSFEGASAIPMAGLHDRGMEVPGLILCGDTIGLVEASGGCGIVAAMKNARFLVDFLEGDPEGEWDSGRMARYNEAFGQSAVVRSIRGKYRKVLPLMRLGFGRGHRERSYARLWTVLGWLYRQA